MRFKWYYMIPIIGFFLGGYRWSEIEYEKYSKANPDRNEDDGNPSTNYIATQALICFLLIWLFFHLSKP